MKKKTPPKSKLTAAERRFQKGQTARERRAVPWRTQQAQEALNKVGARIFRCSNMLQSIIRDLEIISYHWSALNEVKGVGR